VHTGDVGTVTPHGCIRIIDRKKNIFKLSQGEYVVPDKLENKITQHRAIMQAFVYGDSLKSFVVAVLVPEKSVLEEWAKEQGIDASDYEAFLKNEALHKWLLGEINASFRQAGVS